MDVEGLIGAEVGEKVKADIEKGEQAKHAPKTNEVREVEKPSERSDGEGDEEEAESPVAGKVLDEFDGIGAELPLVGARGEKSKRGKTGEKNDGLEPLAGEK